MSKRHNLSGTPLYKIWVGIKSRCFNDRDTGYRKYGGRGITACDGIKNDFLLFKSLLGDRPEGMQIDRIDNDAHYSCGRCDHCQFQGWTMNIRWATRKENCRNTRQNRYIEFNGELKTIGAWAEQLGTTSLTIHRRLEAGWSTKAALTTPADQAANQTRKISDKKHGLIEEMYRNGLSLSDLAWRFECSRETVRKLLKSRGVSIRSRQEQYQLDTAALSKKIEYEGTATTIEELGIDLGIDPRSVLKRINAGIPLESEEDSRRLQKQGLKPDHSVDPVEITIKGQTMSISEWARKIGISRNTLKSRLKKGWSEDKLLMPPKW